MRILKVTQAFSPFEERGGQVATVCLLARALARRGHAVTVLTAALEETRVADRAVAVPGGWRRLEDGVEIFYLRTAFSFRALTINPALARFSRRVREFDLVHIYGLYDLLGPFVARWCRRYAVPYVVEPMGMFRPIDRSRWLKGLWRHLLGDALTRQAAQFVATSELERDELIADGLPPARVALRYNPVDVEGLLPLPPRGAFRRQLGIAPEEPLVLFLSRLIPRKGADLLIQAFADALPRSGVLVIAGPEGIPGFRAQLERIATSCRVADRVRFPGPLFGEQKHQALADADLFALPSRYENFGNAAAEALACGVPALLSPHCGVASLARYCGGMVVPRERQAIGRALAQYFADASLRHRLCQACSRLRDLCHPERIAAQQESLYTHLLSPPAGSY